jgi:hypothetical protein
MAAPLKSHTFRARFAFVYGVLAALAAVAVGAGIYEMTRPGPPAPVRWPWTPTGTKAEQVREIATHVSAEYSAPNAKKQLAQVRGSALEYQSQTIKIAKTTTVQNQVKVLDGTAVQYVLCGPNDDCSFPPKSQGVADSLMRREGLELALYTFRNVTGVSNVVVFLPPSSSGADRTRVMVFTRNDVASQLDRPLTLPGQSNEVNRKQALVIAKKTDPFMYRFTIAPVSGADGSQQPAIVIDPEGLDGQTDQSAPTTTGP